MFSKNLVLFLLLISGIIFAQDQTTFVLPDSVIVLGSGMSEASVTINSIDISRLSNLSTVNYDLFSSLSLIGASYQNDFNVMPLLEGADFQEQGFLIESIPSAYPINLLGIQSGLNSLLFSTIGLEKNSSFNSFSKTINLNANIRQFNNTSPVFASRISNLRTESLVSVPVNNINSNIIIGYHRSLLESMKPIYNYFIRNRDFEFPSFPYYEGFQFNTTTNFENIKLTNLMMTNYDKGSVRLNSKDFNFNSKSLSLGSKLEINHQKSSSIIAFHYLDGKNNINYSFDESIMRVNGLANLKNLNTGIDLNSKIFLSGSEKLLLNIGYKYDEGNSKNEAGFFGIQETTIAKYHLSNYELGLGYQKMLMNKIFIGTLAGMTYSSSSKVGFFTNLDFFLNLEQNLDLNVIIGYRNDFIPTNAIFYTFQNSIWDPASVNTLYFIDQSTLQIKPIQNFNAAVYLNKRINSDHIGLDFQLKLFYRQNNNLIFSNNYPFESTYYNTDFAFNQDYSAEKYGVMLSFSQNFYSFSLLNRISFGLMKSMNMNPGENLTHHALNYNPLAITDVITWSLGNLNISSFLMFKLGRYFFNKSLDEYVSYPDSNITYSLKTDLSNQERLNSQFRLDISLNYLLIPEPFKLDFGISVLNVFNGKYESNRVFFYEPQNSTVSEKSEFIRLPRFIIINLNFNYSF